MHPHIVAIIGMTAALECTAADGPPRTNRVVCAVEAPVCARASVDRNETIVERSNKETRSRTRLWSVPLWLNIVRIDENGDNLLVEQSALATHPAEAASSLVVLEVYSRGALRRAFRLNEILPAEADLQTALRLGAWGKALGSPDSEIAKYLLVTGGILKVNLVSATFSTE